MKFLTLLVSVLLTQLSFGQETDAQLLKEAKRRLKQLSTEEKIAQTCQLTLDAVLKVDEKGRVLEPLQLDETKLKEVVKTNGVGSILNVSSHTLDLKTWATIIARVHQFYQLGETKTPVLYGVDAIHGANYVIGGTLFPQEIGLAATWNPALAEEMGKITAYETRASGVPWNFSPVLDLGRQPLWSRYFETLGEDPYLVSKMGDGLVKGYQGKSLDDPYTVLSCMKHFVGYSYPNSGRDRTPAWIPERQMEELFLPPFKSAVEAGALSVMINSGDVNGIPGHINHHLITEVLKNRWGFKGFAVSDWEDFRVLHTVHKVAKDQKEAIILAFNAGVDMSMVPYYATYSEYLKLFKEAVEEGRISKKRLDDAVARILFVKLKLGLYKKQVYNQDLYSKFGSQEFKNAARIAAQESITLLKNDNNILPLSKNERILLIGEAADNLIFQNGAWTHTWQGVDTAYNTVGALTIRQAFEKQIGAKNLHFEKGYDLSLVDGWETCNLLDVNWLKIEAKMADKIVVCLGEMPATEKPGDIRSLNLPQAYVQLMQELASTGKPIVLVTMFGKPRIVREVEPFVTAIFNAYLPGDYGSEALVDLVYGKENPSGKLPFTYPKYDGVIEHYDYTNAEAKSGKNELNQAHEPQWPFGFGMSYSSFSYTNLKLSKNTMQGENDFITAEITVTNTGKSKGKETVQWYITDDFASITPANKRLKSFEKIELNSGESKTVSFKISTSTLEFVGLENKWIFEKGSFTISVGGQKASFELR